MDKQVISPRWELTNPFGGGKILYVDSRLLDFNEHVWGGNVRDYWEKCKSYLQYLKNERVGELNLPEVYDLMMENVDHILVGEPLVWGVHRFGYERTLELRKNPTFPSRSGFYKTIDNKVLNTGHGGISDGEYVNFMPYLNRIYEVTFGIDKNEVMISGASKESWIPLPLEEKIKRLERKGLPYQIVDKINRAN